MQCTHSIQFADVGMLQMNKAESKPHAEENNYYDNFLDSSSYNSVSYPLQILHDSRIFLVLNASYTNKRTRERDRRTVRQTDRQTDRNTDRDRDSTATLFKNQAIKQSFTWTLCCRYPVWESCGLLTLSCDFQQTFSYFRKMDMT